ncbi:methylated-DNA--[protein]-cysteine S-methyltransferase [Actinomycetota bacterium]
MILYRSSFSTKIGILHYLWVDSEEGQRISFISTSSGSLKGYIKKISTTGKGLNSVSINEKKLPILERKISAYLDGSLRNIELEPIFLIGSEFEKKIWKAASKVPFGNISSYKEIAEICGRPQAYRAVGNAMGKNPVLLLVPCHRILKSDGSLGGFSAGLNLKKRLLNLEGVT